MNYSENLQQKIQTTLDLVTKALKTLVKFRNR